MYEPYKSYSLDKFDLLYELANQFLELGKRGFEKKEINDPMPFASIVNIAFSIELFLKYLHEIYGKPMWGHKLDVLYENLHVDDKNTIAVSLIFSYTKKGKVDELKHGKFTDLLKNHSELYEGFRYLYDNKNKKMAWKSDKIDFGFLMDFVTITKGVCDQKRTNKNPL